MVGKGEVESSILSGSTIFIFPKGCLHRQNAGAHGFAETCRQLGDVQPDPVKSGCARHRTG